MIVIQSYNPEWSQELWKYSGTTTRYSGTLRASALTTSGQRYPLLFRDYLRTHPNSVRSIELIKREIAKRHADDVETYYVSRTLYMIWDAAQDWAKYTNGKLD